MMFSAHVVSKEISELLSVAWSSSRKQNPPRENWHRNARQLWEWCLQALETPTGTL